jgi:hypothetical protein
VVYVRYGEPGQVAGAAYGAIATDGGLGQLAGGVAARVNVRYVAAL